MSAHLLQRPVLRSAAGLRSVAGHSRSTPGVLAWLAAMLRCIETRRQLAEMDDRMLRDIGISRAEALREAERAPWDLMPHSPSDLR